MHRVGLLLVVALCSALVWSAAVSSVPALQTLSASPAIPSVAPDAYAKNIRPFLNQFCIECHNADKAEAGLDLDAYKNAEHAKKDRKMWETIQRVIADK
ncbi:MAG: c-type cytochrome domain-containing protein, partial [Gemmataceae bacterium]